MADQKLNVILGVDSSKFNANLGKAQGRLKAFGSKLKSVGSTLTTRLSLPLALAGGAAIKMASDFEESMNKVDVAFKTSSQVVKQFAKTTLETFGIAEGTALDMAALFGDMATSMGLSVDKAADMSTALVGLAGDLASFKNMNIEEVTTALNGVFTGETESLKRLGIVMTEINLKQFAQEQGIKKNIKAMTQAEKVNLRFQFVLKNTANAQGDFSRTSGGAANQMRIFQETMKELGATFGQEILPTFTKIVTKVNNILKSFGGLDEGTKTLILAIGGLAIAIPPLITLIGYLTAAFGALNVMTGGVLLAIGAVAVAIGTVVSYQSLKSNIDDLNISLSQLESNLKKVKNEQDGTTSSSLKLFEAEKKLAQKQLDLAKANRDLESGLLADGLEAAFGITNDKVKQLDVEIAKHETTIENYNIAIKGLKNQLKTTATETENFAKKTAQANKTTLENLQVEWQLEAEAQAFAEEFNNQVQEHLGKELDLNTAFKKAGEAFDPNSVLVMTEDDGFEEELNQQLTNYQNKLNETSKTAKRVGQEISNVFSTMGSNISQTLTDQMGLFGAFAGAFIEESLKMVGQKIQETMAMTSLDKAKTASKAAAATSGAAIDASTTASSVASSATKATGSAIEGAAKTAAASGPAAAFVLPALIAGAVAVVAGAFKKAKGPAAFANGGIVSGPTLGLLAEYSGAKSNPEVIAPLNKLEGMIGQKQTNVNVGGNFRIQGQDLVLALQKADKQRNRII